ncbi:MAG: TonB-dependent receptor [Deltaproteobacteria bacterium]|nr:TonB-dependent receptor [Deltaproteobacteria bacterium]
MGDSPADVELEDPGLGELEDLKLDEIDFGELDLGDEFALLAEENVVVSASRRLQDISESPSTITVFTREQLLAAGVRDLHDILRLVPGSDVHLATQSWSMIGARAGTTEASDLLVVLLDGRDIATGVLGIPLITNLPVPIEAIERVEVIRGPGSTLYGANAYQGVVNITTVRPEERSGVRGVLRGGTQESYVAWASGSALLGGARLLADVGAEQAGTFYEEAAPRRNLRGRLRLFTATGEDSELDLELGASTLSGPGYTGLGPQDISAYLNPYLRLEWHRGGLRVGAWGNLFLLRSSLDMGLRLVGLDGSVAELARLRTSTGEQTIDLRELSGELTAQYQFDWAVTDWLQSTAVVGASLRAGTFTGEVLAGECPQPFTTSADCAAGSIGESRAGLFAQNETRLGEDWLVTLGLRLDANTIQAKPLTGSPRASLIWHPSRQQALRLSYGRSYRKPTLLEARSHLRVEGTYPNPEVAHRVEEIFATQVGNEELGPEVLEAVELGYRGTFLEGKLRLMVDLWAYRSHDAIYFTVDMLDTFLGVPTIKPDAKITFENIERNEDHAGFELTLAHDPLPWLSYGLVYSFRHAFVQPSVETMPFFPEHGVDLWARIGRPAEGPRLWMHLDWNSLYEVTVRDPRSSVAPPIVQELGNRSRLILTGAWRFAGSKGRALEVGVFGSDLVSGIDALGGARRREYPGCPGENCPAGYEDYVGEPLGRELSLFVRGNY